MFSKLAPTTPSTTQTTTQTPGVGHTSTNTQASTNHTSLSSTSAAPPTKSPSSDWQTPVIGSASAVVVIIILVIIVVVWRKKHKTKKPKSGSGLAAVGKGQVNAAFENSGGKNDDFQERGQNKSAQEQFNNSRYSEADHRGSYNPPNSAYSGYSTGGENPSSKSEMTSPRPSVNYSSKQSTEEQFWEEKL